MATQMSKMCTDVYYAREVVQEASLYVCVCVCGAQGPMCVCARDRVSVSRGSVRDGGVCWRVRVSGLCVCVCASE